MPTGVLVVIAVCVVNLVILYCLRSKQEARKEVSASVFFLAIAATILVAGLINWRLVWGPERKSPAAQEPAATDEQSMTAPEGPMGQREPSPRRDLSRLVRQMAVLQEQASEPFSGDQRAALLPLLQELLAVEKLSEEDAETEKTAIEALLTDDQHEKLAAIELPRRGWGGRGGPPRGPRGDGSPESSATPAETSPAGTDPTPAAVPDSVRPEPTAENGSQQPDAASQPSPEDRRRQFRDRMLQIPAVKEAYDAKLAEDPQLAEDQESQRDFFRGIMREISPFQRPDSREVLEGLIAAFQSPPAPVAGE